MRVITWMLAAGSIFLSCLGAEGQQLSVRVIPLHDTVTSGEPIVFDLVVDNVGAESATVDLGKDRKENVSISASGASGSVESAWHYHGGLWLVGTVRIAPRSSFHEQLILSDFSINLGPGSYTIQAQLKQPARAGAKDILLESAHEKIVVKPKDEAQFLRSCEAVASKYAEAATSQEAFDALQILINYKESTAASCLIKAYESKSPYHLEHQLIKPIANTSTAEAKAFLERVVAEADLDDRESARAELSRY